MAEQLFLASASPRRRQILALLGLPYRVGTAPLDEDATQERYSGPIEQLAQWLAQQKALSAHSLPEAADALIVAADTTVVLEGAVLGKPRDEVHARSLLLALRNRWHTVITGIAVSKVRDGRPRIRSASCATPVLMRAYSEEEIATYIASGDPLDKAGAYGIQHARFQPTARIAGCYFNVVGLPLCALVSLLAEFAVYPAAQAGWPVAGCRWSERCLVEEEGKKV